MKNTFLALLCATTVLAGAQMSFAAEAEKANAMPPPPPHEEMLPPAPKGDMKAPKKFDKKDFEEKQLKMQEKLSDELGLTPEQREEAKKVREEGRKKMEPLLKEMRELRKEMDEVRKENMESFEEILTPEQKAQFDKLKKDHADKIKKHDKKKHDKMKKHNKKKKHDKKIDD